MTIETLLFSHAEDKTPQKGEFSFTMRPANGDTILMQVHGETKLYSVNSLQFQPEKFGKNGVRFVPKMILVEVPKQASADPGPDEKAPKMEVVKDGI